MGGEEVTLQLHPKLNTFPEWHKCICIHHSWVIKVYCIDATIAVAIISDIITES